MVEIQTSLGWMQLEMPASASSTPIFLLGIGLGVGLLLFGLFLGFMMGRKPVAPAATAPKPNQVPAKESENLMMIAQELSTWTNRFSGDVSRYQGRLSDINDQVQSKPVSQSRDEITGVLKQIMDMNRDLQNRLKTAEQRLENQTKEIASYLTEARTDGLTGLANRRSFDSSLDELCQWSRKTGSKVSLALIDIDHFKKINDTYGHQAGDQVLQELARRLKETLGDAACLARYGGEEFAAIYKKPLFDAATAIERMRKAIQSDPFETDTKALNVTGSFGVAELLSDEKIGKLVRRSDEALYAAKVAGRNRVFTHNGKDPELFGTDDSLAPPGYKPPHEELREDEIAAQLELEQLRDRLQERLDRIVREETRR